MGPKISVIVPCYKQAHFLSETLNSVINQTYVDWECIIVNDGSPDNTAEIAKIYCEKDSRFKYIYKENGGLSSARNAGIDFVEGEYIQFLDSDDLLEQTKFSKSIDLFLKTNAQIVITGSAYCKYDDISQEINVPCRYRLRKNSYKDTLLNWDKNITIPIHAIMYEKSLIMNNEIRFDTRLPAKEDFDFHLHIFQTKPIIKYIDQSLCYYRIGHASLSNNYSKMLRGTYCVLNSYYKKSNLLYKILILNNVGYRLVNILYISFKRNIDLKNLLKVCLEEWRRNKSTLFLGFLFIPLGGGAKIFHWIEIKCFAIKKYYFKKVLLHSDKEVL